MAAKEHFQRAKELGSEEAEQELELMNEAVRACAQVAMGVG